jgi:hypothetical protein
VLECCSLRVALVEGEQGLPDWSFVIASPLLIMWSVLALLGSDFEIRKIYGVVVPRYSIDYLETYSNSGNLYHKRRSLMLLALPRIIEKNNAIQINFSYKNM